MKINQNECGSCGQCADACENGAILIISGAGYASFQIDKKTCVECGDCARICPMEAIE